MSLRPAGLRVAICGLLGALLASQPLPAAETNAPSAIDLATALRLAGAQNLDVQIAREKVRQAQADQGMAQAKFFPWLAPGLGFRRQAGNVPAVTGEILDVEKNAYTAGVALTARLELGDAIYQHLAAKQLVGAARSELTAQQEATSLEAASGYFELLRAATAVEACLEAERLSTDYARQVGQAADAGIAFRGDASRATVQVERTRLELRRAQEQQRLAAARLAEVLRLDATVSLAPLLSELTPLTLVSPDATLDSLVARALAGRPELRQAGSELAAARKLKDGAVYGPLIPSVGASVGYGGLGGGAGNPGPQDFDSSREYFVGLGWRLGPGGIFDRGRVRAAEARVRSTELTTQKLHDRVIGDVVAARTRCQSLADQLTSARRALDAAEETVRLTAGRKEFGVAVVAEDILAQQDLVRAREVLIGVIAAHNQAQYALLRAVGELGDLENATPTSPVQP